MTRLHTTGPHNELSKALTDSDASVRLAAIQSAVRIQGFSDVAAVAGLVSDTSVDVRRNAASALGSMRAKDSVAALIKLTSFSTESDAVTRAEAAHSLGLIGDKAARPALEAAQGDPDTRVQDAATIALRTLG